MADFTTFWKKKKKKKKKTLPKRKILVGRTRKTGFFSLALYADVYSKPYKTSKTSQNQWEVSLFNN